MSIELAFIYLSASFKRSGETCVAVCGGAGKSAVSPAAVRIGRGIQILFRRGWSSVYFYPFSGFFKCCAVGGIVSSGKEGWIYAGP